MLPTHRNPNHCTDLSLALAHDVTNQNTVQGPDCLCADHIANRASDHVAYLVADHVVANGGAHLAANGVAVVPSIGDPDPQPICRAVDVGAHSSAYVCALRFADSVADLWRPGRRR